MAKNLHQALRSWKEILGKENIVCNSRGSTRQKILAILKPHSIQEIKECLKVACRWRIPIYPISSGRNWGFGSQVPTVSSVLLNLEKMNRILDFDDQLGYITIEPGVTQKQVADYLYQNKSKFFISVTGASPETSVVGNVLERGDASGIYADRCQYIAGVEVIFPNGDSIRTGYGRFGENKLSKLHRMGVGPQLDGLFVQSNFGIVTQMTVWLNPLPNYLQLVTFSFPQKKLKELMEELRVLKLNGTFKSTVSLWNPEKSKSSGSTWQGCTALYSTSQAIGLAERKFIKKSIQSVKLNFLGFKYEDIYNCLHPTSVPHEHFLKFLSLIKYSQHVGVPNENNIRCVFTEKNTLRGILSVCVSVPAISKDVENAIHIVEKNAYSAGFKPHIALLYVGERYVTLPVFLIYERNKKIDRKALFCHNQILEQLMLEGYFPTRLGIHSMHTLVKTEGNYVTLLSQLKNTLDPLHIIAPGRYEIPK